jgi:Phage integrase, N-terminal SAM-like domain
MSRVVSLKAAMEGRVLRLGLAIDEFLADGDFMASTVEVYERTLEALREDLGADVDTLSITRTELERHLRTRYGARAAATYNRNLATVGSSFAWLIDRGMLPVSPAARIKRRKERVSRTQERQAQLAAGGLHSALSPARRHGGRHARRAPQRRSPPLLGPLP